MAEGFYERLGVDHTASPDDIKAAYQRKLAELVRRLRTARKRGADVSILESRERSLREAVEVLQDRNRRRRYDAYLDTMRDGLPDDADALWEKARSSLVDPVAAAGLASVQALTDLPTGDPLPELTHQVNLAASKGGGNDAPLHEPLTTVETEKVIRFNEDVPTVADQPAPHAADDEPSEGSIPGLSTLNEPLPAAQFDLHGESLPDAGPAMVQVSEEPAPEPQLSKPVQVLDGHFLSQMRQDRGMSLDELAGTTRISVRYLEAIEDNAFDRLPAAPFVRGYVRQVAQILGIDDQGVVEGFMDMYHHHRG